MNAAIDINCDMGEDFGPWRIGDAIPEQLFPLISSANIAAGFHAGDPSLMDKMVRLAQEHGVGIGVHPGYRDFVGFGRRRIDGTNAEILNDIIYQIGALQGFLGRYDAQLQHVKPHGALYMEMANNRYLAEDFIEYMRKTLPNAHIFCMGNTDLHTAALQAGQPVVKEFFADRHYGDDGRIVFTRDIGILSPEDTAAKVLKAVQKGVVTSVSGKEISIEFDSVCFHSDTPGCLQIAQAIRDVLVEHNYTTAQFPIAKFQKKAKFQRKSGSVSVNKFEIKSPLPGTFYRRPSPDDAYFKEDGDEVAHGEVIGLIEVMKSFHEVHADVAGRKIEYKVEDSEAVMAGQCLAEVQQ